VIIRPQAAHYHGKIAAQLGINFQKINGNRQAKRNQVKRTKKELDTKFKFFIVLVVLMRGAL
jgi:hypothetical protein